MELIKKYVYAVTQKLPEQQRADIEKELTGLIEDMLDVRTQGAEVREKDVEEVLLELGEPAALAARYRGKERYLISPEHFNPYVSVLKVVLLSVIIGITVASVIEFFVEPDQFVKQFAEYLATLFAVSIQGFAWVTIIFAVLEYKGVPTSDNKGNANKHWKPSDLPSIPDAKTRIKASEPILGIIFSILFLVLFTFAIDLVGLHRYTGGQSMAVPVFDEEVFRRYVPFIWLITAIAILRDCLKMITRKWTAPIVVFHLLFNVVSLILALVMFSDPAIWNPTFIMELVNAGVIQEGTDGFDTVTTIWNSFQEGLIVVIALITIIDSVAVGLKLYRK